MKPMRGAALLCLLLSSLCLAGQTVDWRLDRMALQESLRQVEPWARTRWLTRHGLQDYYRANSWEPRPDSGLTCVGRWSYGPSVKVSLRATSDDTIICLARGSGASIIRFRSRDSLTLGLLSDINCSGIVSRAIIRDTFVFCGMQQGGTGFEVWGISDPSSPNLLSRVSLPPVHDLAVNGNYLYTTAYSADSFRVFSIADPRNPVRLGACSDSGEMMSASGNHCYVGSQYGLFVMDVSNPAAPRRIATVGADVIAVAVRDTLCFLGTTEFSLRVYNVRNPAAPIPVGSLSGVEASDIYLPPTCDTVLYTPRLHVISIADPRSPRQVGFVDCPGWDFGVTAAPALNYAFAAAYFDGLVAVNVGVPTSPRIDTVVFSAGLSEDLVIDDDRLYVAQNTAGLRILDISRPALSLLLGAADTLGTLPRSVAVVARDSFAFIGWSRPPWLRAFEVSDSAHPLIQGGADLVNPPEDMVLRDSWIYVAEGRRFEVVNVARPREPRLVGSCVLPDQSGDLTLQGNTAYVTNDGLFFVDIANPQLPQVVGTWPSWALGVEVRDTVAYCSGVYFFATVSVANLSMPRTLDSLWLVDNLMDVAVVDSFAYAGGNLLRIFNCADPSDVRQVGSWTPPYAIRRVIYEPPYLYVACWDAGVCILETTQVGIAERDGDHGPTVGTARGPTPNPAGGTAVLQVPSCGAISIEIYNVAGARVTDRVRIQSRGQTLKLGVGRLAPGVYLVDVGTVEGRQRSKLVKN